MAYNCDNTENIISLRYKRQWYYIVHYLALILAWVVLRFTVENAFFCSCAMVANLSSSC